MCKRDTWLRKFVVLIVFATVIHSSVPTNAQILRKRGSVQRQPVANTPAIYVFETDWIDDFRANAGKLAAQLEKRGPNPVDLDAPAAEPELTGWRNSEVEPIEVLKACHHLSIRPGWRLHAYLLRAGENGNGFVVAVRQGTRLPTLHDIAAVPGGPREIDLASLDNLFERMIAIVGDGSPASYVEASMVRHELGDFGARWHGITWGTHEVLDRLPVPKQRDEDDEEHFGLPRVTTQPSEWQWKSPQPTCWRPSVLIDKDCVTVTFFTFSALMTDEGGDKIIRHQDIYLKSSYSPIKSQQETIAVGKGGFCF